jgi:hypothetical protein
VAETLGCEVTLLGIEPADTSFGEGLTPAVERAVAEAARQATNELVRRSEAPEISQTTPDPRPHPLPPLRGEGTGRPSAVAERGRTDSKDGGSEAPPILRETSPLPRRVSTSGEALCCRGRPTGLLREGKGRGLMGPRVAKRSPDISSECGDRERSQ